MTAYQPDMFGNINRIDPWRDICISKFRQYCPVPPFPKTEIYKIIYSEIISDTPQIAQALRGVLKIGNEENGIKLIEAALRHPDSPAPDTIARALRSAREYLEGRNELAKDWNTTTTDRPSLNEMLIQLEENSANIDSSLEARLHNELLNRLNGKISIIRPGRIGAYTVDFLIPVAGVSVEIDGWEYHSDKLAFTKDRRKARLMQRKGYTHLQYAGSELAMNGGIKRTADEIINTIQWRLNGRKND